MPFLRTVIYVTSVSKKPVNRDQRNNNLLECTSFEAVVQYGT